MSSSSPVLPDLNIITQVVNDFLQVGSRNFVFDKSQAPSMNEGKRYEDWEISNLERKEEYVKGLFCVNCKAETVVYFIAQTRRADEQPTTSFICRSCGESWRK